MKRILFLAANPLKTTRLRLEEQVREIQDGIDAGKEDFHLVQRWAVTPKHLRRAVLRTRPHFVHFAGHGERGAGIVLQDKDGLSYTLPTDALTKILSVFRETLECVFLDACYTSDQANALATFVPYVICVDEKIDDTITLEFSCAFYDALVNGEEVPWAFRYATASLPLFASEDPPLPRLIEGPSRSTKDTQPSNPETSATTPETCFEEADWGTSPEVSFFVGRQTELKTLLAWVRNGCRLICLLGLGGIGKTSLLSYFCKRFLQQHSDQRQFSVVVWRNLLNAPSFYQVAQDLVSFLSKSKVSLVASDPGTAASELIKQLQQRQCLLILDNIESILASENPAEVSAYNLLFKSVAMADHRSCLILTSREQPDSVSEITTEYGPIRTLTLHGLADSEAMGIFENHELNAENPAHFERLSQMYDGNPLALEIVARHICIVFSGSTDDFLESGTLFFEEISSLLDWHLSRVSKLELEVLFWLAVEREPVTLTNLKEDLLSSESKERLPSTLYALQKHIPLDKTSTGYSLQPVLIEYMTSRLIETIGQEITLANKEITTRVNRMLVDRISAEVKDSKIETLNRLALQKAVAKRHVKRAQRRLIIEPILSRLLAVLLDKDAIERLLERMIKKLRLGPELLPGYAAGNLINMLRAMGADLCQRDFSKLAIWQARLSGIELQGTNFSTCHFSNCTFTDTFGNILAVRFSRQGNYLAASGTMNEIRVWHLEEKKLIQRLSSHTDWIWAIDFDPAGNLLASGSNDCSIKIWDLSSGECIKSFDELEARIRCVRFSADGRFLGSCDDDGNIKVWDLKEQECITRIRGHDNRAWALAWAPSDEFILTGGEDTCLKAWEPFTGEEIASLRGHTGAIRCITFLPGTSLAVTGSEDGSVRFWNIEERMEAKILRTNSGEIWSLDCAPTGDRFCIASNDNALRIFDWPSLDPYVTFNGHYDFVRSVAFDPTGNLLVSGSEDQSVRIWDVEIRKNIYTFRAYTSRLWAVAVSADEKILAAGADDGTVYCWDLNSGDLIEEMRPHSSRVWSLRFSSTAGYLASCSADGTIATWDAETSNLSCWQGHSSLARAVAASPSEPIIVTGGEDCVLRLWNLEDSAPIEAFEEDDWISTIDFCPGGSSIATGGESRRINVRSKESGCLIASWKAHDRNITSVRFIGKNTLASCSEDGWLKFWRLEDQTWVSMVEFLFESEVWALATDGQQKVAVGLQDGSIIIFEGFTIDHKIPAHNRGVRGLQFWGKGARLASCSEDGCVILWNLEDGTSLRTLRAQRPYEGMRITGALGLTAAEKRNLIALGAVQ